MEIVRYICPVILFIFTVLAMAYAFIILWSEERKDKANRLLIAFCISSAIWSVGFGALIIQTDAEWAYRCRVIGMIGTIMYLITGQMLVSYLSGIKKRWANLFDGFACLGIIVYFLTVERSQTIFHLEPSGMAYSFKPGMANNIYTTYCLILIVLMFGTGIYMCASKVKRIRHFGKVFMLVDAVMLLGTVLDTVFPLLGFRAIPGSTMTQFLGVVVVFVAIRDDNRSKINMANMSEFIYYSLEIPVLVYSSDKHLQIANDAAAKFLGIDQDQIFQANSSLDMFFNVENDSAFEFEGTGNGVDAVCIQNQAYCNLAINKIQDRYHDVIGYIIIVTDLSERMKNLQRLEEAKQEAEAANRAKSDFLANMSHEIRTPMNAILGFSELLLKKDISDTVRDYVSDIKNSSLNLLAVINDILDISKLDAGRAELSCNNYYTAFLLQDVYHIIEIQARKKGLRFEMNADPRIPNELYGDMTRVRGILINLLNNAVKYTERGSVVFNIRLLGMDENTATLEYAITDTGVGLKESAIEHLFDSFTRFDTKRNANIEGTGLGLAIVNGYVKLMNGSVKVDSIYGRGSTFTVTLKQEIVDDTPLNLTKTTAQDSDSLNASEMKIRDTHVLVTDDNPINLKVIKNTLECYGLHVETAGSGKEAVSLCEKTSYDIVFMDQMMPEMDGIETMQCIRKLSSHYEIGAAAKIIALTANAILGVRNELMEKGFDEYLSKPVKFQELERVLKEFVPENKFVTGNREIGLEQKGADTKEKLTLEELLPQMNVKEGMAHCSGNRALYLEILSILCETAPEQLAKLRELKEQKAYPDFIVEIHGMKGQLLNIGYSKLAEEARALEFAGKEKRYEYIEQHLAGFVESYESLVKQLEDVKKQLEE